MDRSESRVHSWLGKVSLRLGDGEIITGDRVSESITMEGASNDLADSLSREQPLNLQSQGASSSSQSYQSRRVEYDDDESVLSDETVSDLPGPGRLLDKLYQKGGRALERAANRLAQKYMSKVGDKPESGNGWADRDDMGNGAVAVVSKDRDVQFIDSSDASSSETLTASNLPGPGRGIDQLYSRGGRILEDSISTIAHKLGYGPHAMAGRIDEFLRLPKYVSAPLVYEKNWNMTKGGWKKMLKYVETGTPQTRMTAMERMLTILFQYSMNEREWDSVIQATEKTVEQTLALRKVHKSREHGNAVHAADLVSNQFFTLLLLLNRLRTQLRSLTEQRSLVAEFIENYYGDAPLEMEDGLNEAFAVQMAPYAEPIVRELQRAVEETGHSAAVQSWWIYFSKVGIGITPRVLAILFRSIAMCEDVINGRSRKYVDIPLTMRALFEKQYYPAVIATKLGVSGQHVTSDLDSDADRIYIDELDLDGEFKYEAFDARDGQATLLSYVQSRIPSANPRIQNRIETMFIEATKGSGSSRSSRPSRRSTRTEEIIISPEYKRDLEVWRRELGEVPASRREGSYKGRKGILVDKEWEVKVFPGRIVYGELRDDGNWTVWEDGKVVLLDRKGHQWWELRPDGRKTMVRDYSHRWQANA